MTDRIVIDTPINIYVTDDHGGASQSNTGETPASPWPAQYAADFFAHKVDSRNARVTFQIVNEAKLAPIGLSAWFGTCNVDPGNPGENGQPENEPAPTFSVPTWRGDPNDITACRIGNVGDPFAVLGVHQHKPYAFNHLTLQGQVGLGPDYGSSFYALRTNFDADTCINAAWDGSKVELLRGFHSIVTSRTRTRFAYANRGGQILDQGSYLDIVGNPTMVDFASVSLGGLIDLSGGTPKRTGTIVGRRWSKSYGGFIVRGQDLPGTLPGLDIDAPYISYFQRDLSLADGYIDVDIGQPQLIEFKASLPDGNWRSDGWMSSKGQGCSEIGPGPKFYPQPGWCAGIIRSNTNDYSWFTVEFTNTGFRAIFKKYNNPVGTAIIQYKAHF